MGKNNVVTVRGTLLGGNRVSDVVVENGMVTRVGRAGRGRPTMGGATAVVAPTLFDIQVNGYGGVDLHGSKVSPGDVERVGKRLAAGGVSYWVPTLTTGSQQHMEQGCRVLGKALRDRSLARHIPGIHLEGPYISPNDGPRGAHPRQHVRKPSLREFDRCMKAAEEKILYVTVAPEVEGAISFIKGLVKRGVVVSLGHHDANADQIARAVDAGARLSTHLANGMAPRIQRHHNPIWPQLAEDRLTASLIADLEHLPEPVLKAFVRAKGPDRIVLTSDVVYVAGLKPGKHRLAGVPVELKRSGRICLSGTELLAGSSLMLLQGVVNAARVTDLSLEQAFASATTIPARLLGLRRRFDLPKQGKKASFVVFEINKSKPHWKVAVRAVFIDGAQVVPAV